MSSLEAGMADCNVRIMGEIGSNGKESNSCMHATRFCTHCSSSLIRFGPHSTCFLFAGFRFARALWTAWILATLFTFWNAPVTAFHSKGWKASQISFCFLCSWYTLSTYPTPCWSRGFLWLTGWSQCEGRRSGRQGEIAQKSWYLTFSSKERYLLVTCSQLVLVA